MIEESSLWPPSPARCRNSCIATHGQFLLLPLVLMALTVLPPPTLSTEKGQDSVEESAKSDTDIRAALSSALGRDQGVRGYEPKMEIEDGVVTLSGTANSLLAKHRAARIAQTVKGVRAVTNQIEVVSPERPDEKIVADVRAALHAAPSLESSEPRMSAGDGKVTLNGTVDSWQERRHIENVVRSVVGVVAVDNQLRIRSRVVRPDEEIAEDVRSALRWDTLVDDSGIKVSVSREVVTLSGSVGSAAEKSRAIADAWVMGVRSVNARHLDVGQVVSNQAQRAEKYSPKTAFAIEKAIRTEWNRSPEFSGSQLDVLVTKGTALLRGEVNTLKAKRLAARLARGRVDVWRVNNRLEVRRLDRPIKNEKLARNVRQALLRNPYVSRSDVGVSAKRGAIN